MNKRKIIQRIKAVIPVSQKKVFAFVKGEKGTAEDAGYWKLANVNDWLEVKQYADDKTPSKKIIITVEEDTPRPFRITNRRVSI